MTWRDVLDSKLAPGTHISEMVKLAKQANYQFFAFNGRVYNISGEDTGIAVSSLR